jgi:hypothetical protein
VDHPLPTQEEPLMFDTPQLAADLRMVAGTPEGLRVMWELLSSGGIYASTFRGEQTHASAYAEGRRAATLELMAALNDHAPVSLAAMLAHQHQSRATSETQPNA